MMNKAIAACALALAATTAAQAQTVYRCGSSYSERPCTEGQALRVEDRKPSQEEAAAAAANAKRDAKLADSLEKERLAQEKAAAKTPALLAPKEVAAPAPQMAASLPKASIKGRKPEQFKAVAPPKPGDTPAKPKKKKSSA
jgi:hypothetical protein